MNRSSSFSHTILSALPRFALLAAMLLTPLAIMQSVQAATGHTIEDNRKLASGAGLVLFVGLQRG